LDLLEVRSVAAPRFWPGVFGGSRNAFEQIGGANFAGLRAMGPGDRAGHRVRWSLHETLGIRGRSNSVALRDGLNYRCEAISENHPSAMLFRWPRSKDTLPDLARYTRVAGRRKQFPHCARTGFPAQNNRLGSRRRRPPMSEIRSGPPILATDGRSKATGLPNTSHPRPRYIRIC